jgi:two-component system response regulator EvgA
MAVRVLIVDDAPDFRRLARMLLSHGGYEVIGEASDGETALRLAFELRPDLVLLDIQLPDIDGFEVARQLDVEDDIQVVLVSSRDEADYGTRVTSAPAAGFLAKSHLSVPAVSALLSES